MSVPDTGRGVEPKGRHSILYLWFAVKLFSGVRVVGGPGGEGGGGVSANGLWTDEQSRYKLSSQGSEGGTSLFPLHTCPSPLPSPRGVSLSGDSSQDVAHPQPGGF